MTPRQQLITRWGLRKKQAVQMVYNYVDSLCMVVFPLLCTFFFADLMKNGLPTDMPAGAVDLDQTSTSRKLVRTLDAMQLTSVKKIYPNATEARRAMQRGEIYGFFYIPENFNKDVQAGRQPVVSFYYNGGYILAGSMLYKDMKTTATLGTAAVGMTKLAALGMTEREIMANLQPITVDTRITHNPTMDYNVYLSTSMIPTCLGIFIFLITVYSLGTELKFRSGKRWMGQAKGNIWIAMTAKMLPQTFVFTAIVFAYLYGLYGVMHFPYYCSKELILFNGFLLVLACQGFGVFMFGLLPSLRMAMSLCALFSVASFSIGGFTFPVEAMDAPLQALAYLFPMRSYFMIYQMTVLNGYAPHYAQVYYLILLAFILLPLTVIPRICKVMLHYVYIP